MLTNRLKPILILILGLGVAMVALWAQNPQVRQLLDEAEKLHDAKNYQATMEKLRAAEKIEPNNPVVLWRIARGYFDFADQQPDNPEVQKQNIYPGFEYAKRCVELAPEVAGGHQYYAILIGRIGEIEGTKQKITNSYAVREHTLKAIELDPANDSNYHVMGRWNFALADLSWVERQIASVIYATPPKASFEEAVTFFRKAHEIKPNDIRHRLWLAKSYLKLDRKADAKTVLEQLLKLPATSDSDRAMLKEAQELIKKL